MVGNLTKGDEYQFRVRAVNVIGTGDASKPTDLVTAVRQPCLCDYSI